MTILRRFRGGKKSKKHTWVESPGHRWHRIDPTDGRKTACGIRIDPISWGFPVAELYDDNDNTKVCLYTECRGIQ